VDVSVYGDDLRELREVADAVAASLRGVPGAADVRVLAPPEVPLAEVVPLPGAAARHGWTPRDVLDAVAALRQGLEAGDTYDGPVRVPVRVLLPTRAGAFALGDTGLPSAAGELVPLRTVATVTERSTPGLVSRQGAQRRLVVGFNVRGADLRAVVEAAERRAAAVVRGRDAVRLVWGGQYESFEAARRRLAVVIPAVLAAIVLVLLWTFRRVALALLILLNVPFACVGGALLLWARGLPLSMPAAVGFIALSGVAVLNGVVWASRLLQLRAEGGAWDDCARDASRERVRPVLMTALVALLGFVPMTLATGTGAEVQRPLATVVVGGLPTCTVLTLVILPAIVAWYGRRARRA
jgi:cobalt-zinc-cadmium resistance protein CzcA